jgi:hypothetical protein
LQMLHCRSSGGGVTKISQYAAVPLSYYLAPTTYHPLPTTYRLLLPTREGCDIPLRELVTPVLQQLPNHLVGKREMSLG